MLPARFSGKEGGSALLPASIGSALCLVQRFDTMNQNMICAAQSSSCCRLSNIFDGCLF
jgi:hypothetical protein